MNADLLHDVLRHIDEFNFKPEGDWLRKGECPNCHKKELYTQASKPWVLRCGRLAKCGYEAHVKDLYPEIFSDWSTRAKPRMAENPNAAADDYMQQARGFDLARIKGWYRQEAYYDAEADNGKGAGSATVRFAVGGTYWQRLIDKPGRFGKKKAVFGYTGSYKGHWWQPPTMVLADVHELWITEGIFNAIALEHAGVAAVSAMSCNNYPAEGLAALRKAHAERGTECVLVWALDADAAGTSYTPRWVDRARQEGWECKCALVPQRGKAKIDWNDLLQRDKLGEEDRKEYLYHGALLIAESASAKGLLIYNHSGGRKTEFAFDHEKRLYWFKLDLEAYNRAVQQLEKEGRHDDDEERLRDEAMKQAHVIRPIANCLPTPLYYQENVITDESWYYFRVEFPHDGAAVKNTFSSGALVAAAEFKKRLLSIAPGAMFSGTSAMLDRMMEEGLYQIQRVETIDFLGYSKEHKCYVLGDLAVKGGKQVALNDEDYFDFGKLSLKSLNSSVMLRINADLPEYRPEWFGLLWRCFGAKGLAALTFWLGALFAEQIRGTQKSYPFLEVVGEAGAGKSTLIEFLWKLVGRSDYEGFDPSKSSLAARARNFAQVSNLPVVLIESDREKLGNDKGMHVKSFDWDELKTAFNGRGLRARGMATGGNETYEPPFRGAIVISQNNEVNASEPILQRIVHLTFDRAGQTPKTREAALALEQMPVEHVSGWVLRTLLREAEVLETLASKTPVYEKQLQAMPAIKSMRIAKNHGQLLALSDALRLVTPMTDDQHEALQAQLVAMAEERQQAISADHPIVAEFWETFEYLDEGTFPLNHSRTPNESIAINLNHFVLGCRERGQAAPSIADLKKVLRTSKRYPFDDCRAVNSALKSENAMNASPTIWCWVFNRKPAGAKR